MDIITLASNAFMLIEAPKGLWETIIFAFERAIPNYAWAIIIFTIVLKLLLTPLDFFNKKISRKNAKMQQILQPEMKILQQKYGTNKEVLNQKTMELYKKHNYNVMSSCGVMLLNLALTMVIFFTLFGALNKIAQFKIYEQYAALKSTYEVNVTVSEEQAQAEVKKQYDEISGNYKWLWIKNIWQSDSPFSNSIPTFAQYANLAKLNNEEKAAEQEMYEKIMNPLRETSGRVNGYLILVILSAGSTALSQLFAQSSLKKKKEKKVKDPQDPAQMSGKVMLVLMPLLMGYITFQYNAVFAIYIVAGSLFSLATTPIVNTLIDKLEDKSNAQKAIIVRPKYDRNIKK